jgi:hypothetical protein
MSRPNPTSVGHGFLARLMPGPKFLSRRLRSNSKCSMQTLIDCMQKGWCFQICYENWVEVISVILVDFDTNCTESCSCARLKCQKNMLLLLHGIKANFCSTQILGTYRYGLFKQVESAVKNDSQFETMHETTPVEYNVRIQTLLWDLVMLFEKTKTKPPPLSTSSHLEEQDKPSNKKSNQQNKGEKE